MEPPARNPEFLMRDIRSKKPGIVGWLLIAGGLTYLLGFLFLPLASIFFEAFSRGVGVFWATIIHPETQSAISLTLISVLVAVPLNVIFGIMAAWAITRFEFPGKQVLITLIDIPFSVSPIVAGLVLILVYGQSGWLGPWFESHGIKVIFAKGGVILATTFVTLPFVVRELIPLMQSQGRDDEEAALTLGANGWQLFRFITLPNIQWALIYGIILCNARAMGEFGAASVVSGFIREETITLPLQIDILFHEYNSAGAFTCACILTIGALVTLGIKAWIEHHDESEYTRASDAIQPLKKS